MDRTSQHAYLVSIQSQLEEKAEEVTRLRRAIVQYRCATEQVTAKCEKQREELKRERLANQRLNAELERAHMPTDNQFDRSTVDSGLSSHSSDDVLTFRQRAGDKDYQAAIRTLEEQCELLAQQCEVSKKERADALDVQEKLTGQCFDVGRKTDALRKAVDDQASRIAELDQENERLKEELEVRMSTNCSRLSPGRSYIFATYLHAYACIHVSTCLNNHLRCSC